MPAQTSNGSNDVASADGAEAVTVLVDDARDFKDGRPARVARTSVQALALLAGLDGRSIDDLWLDYDLIGDDTAQPVVDHLVALAAAGSPLDVARIHIHSSNIRHGNRICAELHAAGYPARRSYAANMWVRATWRVPRARAAYGLMRQPLIPVAVLHWGTDTKKALPDVGKGLYLWWSQGDSNP